MLLPFLLHQQADPKHPVAILIDILTVRELRFLTWASTSKQEAAFAKLSAV